MSSVFGLLLLVSLVGLVWGLIAPHHITKVTKSKRPLTRKHTGLGFGILILLFIILGSITAPPQPKNNTKNASYTTKTSSRPKPSKTAAQSNNVTTKQVTETQNIPFTTQDVNDNNLPKGQTKVSQTGKDGVTTITYKITYTNGKQTNKTQVSSKVTTQPINQIVEIGTYVAPAPAPAPAPSPSPSPSPAPSQGCYPLTNGGNCYEPGEYCRNSDHGATGVAGDGESITCADNNGWRWEPY